MFSLWRIEPIVVTAQHFPRRTKDYFPLKDILEWKLLPLGTKSIGFFWKKERLNVGLVLPTKSSLKWVKHYVKEHHPSLRMKVYSISEDSYREVLQTVYEVPKA